MSGGSFSWLVEDWFASENRPQLVCGLSRFISDLERGRRDNDAAARTADNRHIDGVVWLPGHHGAAVAPAAAVLDFADVASVRAIGKEPRRRIGTARFNQHLAAAGRGGGVAVALADFDRVHRTAPAAGN